ncbi:hypothetical protein EJ06DRAFT_132634 [Trichodelitschia bisporula]|uniref:Uncharacterized protein n=1 Tax=Trichodelitschia bisporula TaxID=703511 RepID=A0A6G1HPB1_9PEZI|nr:hypothetical protein EJ06DRAFT_132634 [Trichodelitschia bisporula]
MLTAKVLTTPTCKPGQTSSWLRAHVPGSTYYKPCKVPIHPGASHPLALVPTSSTLSPHRAPPAVPGTYRTAVSPAPPSPETHRPGIPLPARPNRRTRMERVLSSRPVHAPTRQTRRGAFRPAGIGQWLAMKTIETITATIPRALFPKAGRPHSLLPLPARPEAPSPPSVVQDRRLSHPDPSAVEEHPPAHPDSVRRISLRLRLRTAAPSRRPPSGHPPRRARTPLPLRQPPPENPPLVQPRPVLIPSRRI